MSRRGGRARRRARAQGVDILGAEKKLRQAGFFFGWLDQESAKPSRDDKLEYEHLEFLFSACLSAAQSVQFVLEKTGGATFEAIRRQWLEDLTDERERSSFKRMSGLRGEDVHFAVMNAEPMPKYVSEDRISRDPSPYYQRPIHNAAIFGPAPVIEEKNPDGKTVTGPILRGAVGFYIKKRQGLPVEVTDACRSFIEQLTSLVEVMKAALPDKGLAK